MAFGDSGAALFPAASVVISAAAVALLARFAPALGLLDVPGGRKAHDRAVPLVGGLAIFVALLSVSFASGLALGTGYFIFALAVVIAAGCWDDIAEISPKVKFAIQIGATAIMILGGGVALRTLGDLVGWRPIGLSILAVPVTIFAIVGVVNAVN